MHRYATALGGDPAARYRQIDVASRTGGADAHQLVQLLYEELVSALRTVAWATERDRRETKSDKATRAIAILFALEAGLDFDRGGEVAKTLARLYMGARQTVAHASIGRDPEPFRRVANDVQEIAEAWRTARA